MRGHGILYIRTQPEVCVHWLSSQDVYGLLRTAQMGAASTLMQEAVVV